MFVHRIQDILSKLIHYISSSDENVRIHFGGSGSRLRHQWTMSGVNEAIQSSYTKQLILLFIDVFFSKWKSHLRNVDGGQSRQTRAEGKALWANKTWSITKAYQFAHTFSLLSSSFPFRLRFYFCTSLLRKFAGEPSANARLGNDSLHRSLHR